MCGIAGYYNIFSGVPAEKTLERMIVSLRHRGPDGYGLLKGTCVGLGHARLSIIDLEGGWQPMTNEDRSLWIIFNGEIFNYPELREGLLRKGHVFTTDSDTEVILHLYEDKGPACLHDLNGQFAIAIYDSRKEELFLARDRMGIRPLFYTLYNGNFYFASEIKALFNGDSQIPRRFNSQNLADIFTIWTPVGNETVFDGIFQLQPAHWLKVNRNGVATPNQYWDMPLYSELPEIRSERDYAEQLKELLVDAVRLRLRADVPVGAYLSGGLDSSAITSLIKNYTNNPLKTFSVVFQDKVYDEREEQLVMADYLGTDHNQVTCSYNDIASVFDDVIYHTETPILRTAPAPLFLLSNLVRNNNYKVVLTGEGADEVLGGYDLFKEVKIREFIHKDTASSIRPLLLKRLYPYLALSPTKSAEYARNFFDTDANPQDLFYGHRPRWKTTSRTHAFLQNDLIANLQPVEQRLDYLSDELQTLSPFLRAQYLEAKLLLGNYLLSSQGDRMAMANSIEGRFPFLDHRVVEFVGTIPENLKMKVLNEKNILKKAMADILPQKITARKKQPYMAPDILSFFGGKEPEYLKYYLSDSMLNDAGIFKINAVKALVAKCRRKARQGFKENMAFIGILSTQIIYDKYVKNFARQQPNKLENVRVHVQANDMNEKI